MRPGPKSTWSVAMPNLEIHRGHVMFDAGTEVMNIDNLEIYANAKIPFGGPLEAGIVVDARWRERGAPLGGPAAIRTDKEAFTIHELFARAAGVEVTATGVRMPAGKAPKAIGGMFAVSAPAAQVHMLVPEVNLPDDVAVVI